MNLIAGLCQGETLLVEDPAINGSVYCTDVANGSSLQHKSIFDVLQVSVHGVNHFLFLCLVQYRRRHYGDQALLRCVCFVPASL